MEYILTSEPNENEWNELVTTSPQGSLFSQTNYLSALINTTYTCYLVKARHGETLAGLVVIEDNGLMHMAPCRYCAYHGILFSRSVSMLRDIKRVTREFRLTEFLIEALCERYGNFSMAFSPSFKDLRPFQWYNYHENNSPRFAIINRYTATLDLSNFKLESYLKNIRTVRRQEFKKLTAKITETKDLALFLDLYIKTFEKHQITLSPQHLKLVNGIVTSALANGFGRLSMTKTTEGVASMALFVYDSKCAYYLFGANNPEIRNSGASTALIIDNICFMAKLGIKRLDFLGVNSPNRGDYKLSFNSVLTPYYEVHLDSASSLNQPELNSFDQEDKF